MKPTERHLFRHCLRPICVFLHENSKPVFHYFLQTTELHLSFPIILKYTDQRPENISVTDYKWKKWWLFGSICPRFPIVQARGNSRRMTRWNWLLSSPLKRIPSDKEKHIPRMVNKIVEINYPSSVVMTFFQLNEIVKHRKRTWLSIL